EIDALRGAIAALLRRARGLNPNMATHLQVSSLLLEAFLAGGIEAMAAAGGAWSLAEYLRKGVPAPGKDLEGCAPDAVIEVAKPAKDLVAALAGTEDGTIAAMAEAAGPLAQRAREGLLQAGYVSFDALLRLARDLLAEDLAVRRAESARHRV